MRRCWLFITLLLLWVSAAQAQFSLPQPKKAWTVLVYQAGDNDLETALIKDLNEMERIGTGSNLNIVVQLDRSPRYDTSNGNWTTTRRYIVTRDTEETYPPNFATIPNNTIKSQLVSDLGKVNMGDEAVLRDFLLWGIQNFPADRYFIILSDHGAGVRPFRSRFLLLPSRGMMFADTFNDYLSEDETKRAFATVVRALGRLVDIIGLDASEMSEIEIAYQLRDASHYLIASQLSEPNDGYPYDRFLWELAQNPSIITETFLQRFVLHYIESYKPGQPTNGAGSAVTVAVYNQSIVPAYVQKVNALAQVLASKANQFGDNFLSLRRQTQTFSETIYRDLFHYCQLLIKNIDDSAIKQAAQAVMDLHGPGQDKALLYEAHASGFDHDVSNAYGIAIYFPDPSAFDERYLTANDFARTTHWGNFLQQLREDRSPPSVVFIFPDISRPIPIVRPALLLRVEDIGSAGLGSNAVREVQLDSLRLTNFSFDANTGRLLIVPPQPLSAGAHTLRVTVVDLRGNSAQKDFNFTITPPTLQRGVQTFSLPFGLSNGDSRQILQSPDVKTTRWLPDEVRWAIYPEDTRGSLLPPGSGVGQSPAGLGFFIRLPQDIVLTADGTPLEPDRSYAIPLRSGWNLFANPFPVPIAWNSVSLRVGNSEMSLSQAINKGVVLSCPIAYQPNSENPFRFGRYVALAGELVQLQPFSAYWLKVSTSATLVVPGQSQPTTKLVIPIPAKSWSVRLQLIADGRDAIAENELLEFGTASDAKWGQDVFDIPMPPSLPGVSVRAYFVAENWRKRSPELLAADFRPKSERIVWEFVVEADESINHELSLTWKGLETVPSSVRIWLVDLSIGKTFPLRFASVYRFRLNEPKRRFRFIAQVGQSPLRIVGIRANPLRGSRSVLIEGHLTMPATVSATIKTLTGRTVHVLTREKIMPAGRLQFFWDGRGHDGMLLPMGVYLCELTAKDETGAQVRSIVSVLMR